MKINSKNKKSSRYVWALGRRKEATARVRLYSGKGESLVNGLPITHYFTSAMAKVVYDQPFTVTKTLGDYYATIMVSGSGLVSQASAVAHGLARALDKSDPNLHTILKKAGLLTRDPRTRERRKVGMGGKARRAKQSPKR